MLLEDDEETTGKKASVPMNNKQILKGLIRVAHENPETRATLLPIIKKAMEFDTPEALKKYLHDHPGADPKNHTVKKQDSGSSSSEKSVPPVIKDIGEIIKGKSLMDLRGPLSAKFGKKNVDFSHAGAPHFQIKHQGKTIYIVNKQYAEDEDILVGDLAIGYM